MSGFKRYDEDFKQSLVNLYQTGKTQTELCKDYGVSSSALAKWIKQYSQVRLEDNTVLTAKQIQELQKRNAQLEEENLILKKASAIFMQDHIVQTVDLHLMLHDVVQRKKFYTLVLQKCLTRSKNTIVNGNKKEI